MEFLNWLFSTREGVVALFVGGVIIALLVAIASERFLSKRYYNHEPEPDDANTSLFDGLFETPDDKQ